ncbi:MAG: hypothetical protein CL897_06485 [Dehalococcoidia bacterium]|nr:hypothetical protein [Dehalococcoidia bacterium]
MACDGRGLRRARRSTTRALVMRAVFWDLDDTILNTLPGRMEALAGTYEDCLNTQVDAHAVWREHSGYSLEALARELLGEDWRRFAERYRERYYAIEFPLEPFPGVVETLDALVAEGLELAVVTSKISWGATGELTRTGLLDRFATVVGHDDCERHKPEPEPLFVAMERLCLDDPSAIAYVGDTPADVRAAKAAGCHSIGAIWGSLDAERVRAESPDLLAEEPAEVLSYVRLTAEGGIQ